MKLDFDTSEGTLGFYLDRTFNCLVGQLNIALRNVGVDINHSQFIILRAVAMTSGISQNEVSRQLRRDPASVCRSIRSLTEKDIIERKKVSGCKYGLFLTKKGEDMIPRLDMAIEIAAKEALRGISTEEYETGIKFLNKIFANTENQSTI